MGFVEGIEAAGAGNKFENNVVAFVFEGGGAAKEGGEEDRAWVGYVGFKVVC